MKNHLKNFTLPAATFVLLGIGIIVGCEKQENPIGQIEKTSIVQSQEGVTSEEDFEKVFNTTIKMVDTSNHLAITKMQGGYKFSLISDSPSGASERVVCSGGQNPGYTFAKCIRDYTAANGCCTVTYSPSAGWNGNDCPK